MTLAELYQRQYAHERGINIVESLARADILALYREVREIAAEEGIGDAVLDDLWAESVTCQA